MGVVEQKFLNNKKKRSNNYGFWCAGKWIFIEVVFKLSKRFMIMSGKFSKKKKFIDGYLTKIKSPKIFS